MHRKNPPRQARNRRARGKRNINLSYIISRKAEAILSSVLADILEESFEDARNLAENAGNSSVTREDMERSLRNLCLRLSTVPAHNAPIDTHADDNNKDFAASSKVGRTRKHR
ncbi:uncharacterized protein LOC113464315 [Ceratina calcarata]|uniref:Uncharacterized protein LOC113464315 n=1 Tax=Ceratina calcarata TaxID=156304 RepID=A0AAJ7S0N2_9HYME|nr:uncharacterized protein LOC113464315 [Ceratina calcarata]